MLANPKPGRRVILHYAKGYARLMPHHGRVGAVVAAGTGKPRNHLIRLDYGTEVVVPCGNLHQEPGHSPGAASDR